MLYSGITSDSAKLATMSCPNDRLRSWGSVPLHLQGNTLYVPCADTEALWSIRKDRIEHAIAVTDGIIRASARDSYSSPGVVRPVPAQSRVQAQDVEWKPMPLQGSRDIVASLDAGPSVARIFTLRERGASVSLFDGTRMPLAA